MAITADELQSIISAVLSSIRTNSRTIEQLTPVTQLLDTDIIEIGGGKNVTYGKLKEQIIAIANSNASASISDVEKALKARIANAEGRLDAAKGQIDALDTKVSALETSQATQDSEIRALKTSQASQDTTLSNLSTSVTNLGASVTDLEKSVEAAAPRRLTMEELDTMGGAGGFDGMKAVRVELGASGHTRFAVTNGAKLKPLLIGTVDVLCADSCVLTQILTTHHTFEDGVLKDNEHTDGNVRQYFRSYSFVNRADQGLNQGEWTDWQELIPESVQKGLNLNTPIRCTDEQDLEDKAREAEIGQQFYIPEEE